MKLKDYNDYFEKEYGPIRCGSYCPEGWSHLVKDALEKAKELDPDLIVHQIKSKFGGLRLYVETKNKEVFKVIDKAEEDSYTTCVICGSKKAQNAPQGLCEVCRKAGH